MLTVNDENIEVSFIETQSVNDGVECDVYSIVNDNNRDIGIIRIKAGYRTPKQKILQGDKTVEGYITGKGILEVWRNDNSTSKYSFPNDKYTKVELEVGDIMQWEADQDLEVFEICYPPYHDGRFLNLDA